MRIDRNDAVTVIHDDGQAVSGERRRVRDAAVEDRSERLSLRRVDIEAWMRDLGLEPRVDHGAESRRDGAHRRPIQKTAERAHVEGDVRRRLLEGLDEAAQAPGGDLELARMPVRAALGLLGCASGGTRATRRPFVSAASLREASDRSDAKRARSTESVSRSSPKRCEALRHPASCEASRRERYARVAEPVEALR